eukprot:TRINITY_DN126467_c0_g1_i1.p1 TRINITY_DN126467_c0_g1~~TRINITY_DN126467_c0_g1_i1.p1  ORF type:complete len:108 (+),score=22.04 TRINITY_DN126467_c0_g1_i1:87-410(+)
MVEHTENIRPSTKEKHEKAQAAKVNAKKTAENKASATQGSCASTGASQKKRKSEEEKQKQQQQAKQARADAKAMDPTEEKGSVKGGGTGSGRCKCGFCAECIARAYK